MAVEHKKFANLLTDTERIGTIGSPSSTNELTIDILASASEKKLVGELAFFQFNQEGDPHLALGQIMEITLKNVWLEDHAIRSLARHRGPINLLSEQQDTHQAKMTISAVFKIKQDRCEQAAIGCVPPTGTFVHLANDKTLETLLSNEKDALFYLGRVYGSTPKLPLWFKHFGQTKGGAGDTYHLGIFGKTGSGKSVLAKMIILAYARHPEMTILVFDPQGEFSRDFRGVSAKEGFNLKMGEILNNLKRPFKVLSIKDIVLDRWELFVTLLYESSFFERLTVPKGENRRIACEVLADELHRKRKIPLSSLHERNSFEIAFSTLGRDDIQKQIYKSDTSRARMISAYREVDKDDLYQIWKDITELFNARRPYSYTVNDLLKWIYSKTEARPVVVVDLSKENTAGVLWNEEIQALVLKRILEVLIEYGEIAYKGAVSLNTLVVFDEAHRFASRDKLENEKLDSVRRVLLDAVRTTRKYGIGWMFISQTLSSIHREIISQLRIFFFGYGLAHGSELLALRELIGGESNAIRLYQSFKDPHSAFDPATREYSFMTVGPVSPLSFTGSPLFFTAFNDPMEFLKANRLSSSLPLF